jgi:chromosome segregation ATPase
MSTATAAPILSSEKIEQNIRELEKQTSTFTARLRVDEEKLTSLSGELGRVSETIAKGEEKPARASQIKAEIEELQVRVSGSRSLIAENNEVVSPLRQELSRLRDEAARAARLKEFDELKGAGQTVTQGIIDKLLAIATDDLVKLDEIRMRLAREFPDLGGEGAAWVPLTALLDVDGVFLPLRDARFNGWTRGQVVIPIVALHRPKNR